MNLFDWFLVLVALAYALSGYWQGFVSGAFATAGLLLGGVFGIWLAPQVLSGQNRSLMVSLAALVMVLICASFGQGLLQYFGARIRNRITWQPARALDAVGGALLSSAAVLVVAWALGVAVTDAKIPGISNSVRNSEVLGQVDDVMPGQADGVLGAFNEVVGASGFPTYLEPFAPERIVTVDPPDARVARDPDVAAAEASVLKIRGENECGRGVEGTGFLYSPGRIMTNAHVVAGVDNPQVIVGDDEVDATVVHYDEDLDVAVLSVENIGRPFLRFDRRGDRGESAAVLGYPNDGPYDVQAARIRGTQRLRSPDIYREGAVIREVYSIRSLVRPGNSGGPLLSENGDVLGVIFAASVSDPESGYALTAEQVAAGAARGISSQDEVGTGDCAVG